MPGPAPKPEGMRRSRVPPMANTVKLARDGKASAVPKFPLPNPSADERKVWRELWSTPYSVQWERLDWVRFVARYARQLVEAELPGAHPSLLAEVRQMEDRLGLSPMALLRLRWEIVDAAPEQERTGNVVAIAEYGDLYGTG